MKVQEHEHPLKLIDLQQEQEEKEEDDDDEDGGGSGDLTTEEGFPSCRCGRCREEINMYHRYYYKCTVGSCDYSLHKFCGELSTRLVHPSNPFPLTFVKGFRMFGLTCGVCGDFNKRNEIVYECSSRNFYLDINCAVEARKKIIHHPCHGHSLMSAIREPILCKCNACGKRHEGIFFQCTACDTFAIHKDCAFLPKKLLIQQTTHDAFYHPHPLTISYSFSRQEQRAKHLPKCRVCGDGFYDTYFLWTYKCDKCMYYAHVGCATSIHAAGSGKTIKNFEDADHPHLLHLPFPDVSYSLPKHLFFEESTMLGVEEINLKHLSHQHPLILVNTQIEQTSKKIKSWLSLCHNPMKKIQLLCNGCLRPIMATSPFFKCTDDEDEHCDFALHEWCTRLPAKIEKHPGHSQHTLVLMLKLNNHEKFFGVFRCDVCRLPCNGFAYCCIECEYYVDVNCGLIPAEITHKAHPNHLLSVARSGDIHTNCRMCLRPFHKVYQFGKETLAFGCKECDTYIHSSCALSIPESIGHKYDKHPMHLSYLPIENHKSEYFCEICEEGLNPHQSFYHCKDCAQSIHTTCAPSILQSETQTYSYRDFFNDYIATHYFRNIKFGGIHNTDGHPHPLLFSQGTVLDGGCSICGNGLRYKVIFKCLECKFAIDYHCCKYLKKI